MYLPVPGFEPKSSEFLDKCATRWATVAVHKYCVFQCVSMYPLGMNARILPPFNNYTIRA